MARTTPEPFSTPACEAASTPAPPGTVPPPGPRPSATDRTFVVQLSSDPAGDSFQGRVQHLGALDGGNFSSPEGLAAIMRRVLERMRRRDD